MPWYLIKNGTFRDSDDTIKGPGDRIELGEDVAARHPGQVELEKPAEQETPAQA